jgi:hypothetical protein
MAKISYTELFIEIIDVLETATGYKGITKDEHLHAVPRLGIMTTAASQEVAQKLNARPKIQAVGLVATTDDVESSDTVLEFQNLCWGKIPAANKQ